MFKSKLLTLVTLFSSNILADFEGDIAVGRNHWVGNCISLCSESEEYFIDKTGDNKMNLMDGPYKVWQFDSGGERVNCDCEGSYNKINKTSLKNSYDELVGLDISLALDNLIKPVRSFYEIDTDSDRQVSYQEALAYYSKNDPQFKDEDFRAYFNWISYGDGVQEFEEAVVYAAVQSAQLVFHYSMVNNLGATISLRNSMEIASHIVTLFDLGSDVSRDALFRSVEHDVYEAFPEKDVQENKNILPQMFERLIEENLVVLLQN